PDDVVEQLHELATTLNVGQLMLLMQFGNLSSELTKYNTRLFAERVMPKLRSLFADWPNRWWPKPLAARERAQLPAFRPEATAQGGNGTVECQAEWDEQREPARNLNHRCQRLCNPRLAQGLGAAHRLSCRLRRPATLDPVPRSAGRDAHRDRAITARLSRRR